MLFHRRIALIIPMALVFVALLGGVSAAQAPDDSDFLIEPGPGSSTSSQGGYFVVKTKPGRILEQSVVLRNDSNRALTLELGAVDALTGPLGGTSYGLPTDQVTRTGSWISMAKTRVTLRPGAAEEIKFEIRVPSDAASGQHLAGIAAYVPNEDPDGDDVVPGEPGAVVTVQTRRVVSVLIELPGSAAPELVVSGVEPEPRTDAVYLGVAIANEGFGLTEGEGIIELPEHGFRRTFDVGTFVPGTSIVYPIEWERSPDEGEYAARVEISYEGGVARWEGNFVIGEAVSDQLAQNRGDSRPAWLWPAAAIATLLVIALIGLTIRRRRSRGTVIARPQTRVATKTTAAGATPSPTKASPVASGTPRDTSLPPPPPPPARTRPPKG